MILYMYKHMYCLSIAADIFQAQDILYMHVTCKGTVRVLDDDYPSISFGFKVSG